MSPLRTRLAQALGLGVVASGLILVPVAPAQAASGVFISEFHYDNAGTDSGEFIEVTAPAGTNLAGYSIVLYNGSNNQTYGTASALTGIVADQANRWGTSVVDYPVDGIQNGAPDGIALMNGTTVVEFLSYEGGMTAANGPAAGVTATDIGVSEVNAPVGQSLQRQADDTWTGPAANTKGVPNGYDAGGQPGELAATDPGDKEGTLNIAITPFDLVATGGEEPYTWEIAGEPDGIEVSESGTVSGTPTESGEFTVIATVTDGADDVATTTFDVDISATDPSIAAIQGTGTTAALTGTRSTRGVVTAAYPTGGLKGFYLQTPGTGGAIDLATHTASDGMFVFQNNIPVTVTPGDYVRVTGTVGEYAGATQITIANAGGVVELSETVEAPTPVTTAWPDTDAEKESLEGMLFSPEGEFTVTNNYATNQYGELGLAVGDRPLIQPTQVGAVGSTAAVNQKAENAARAITLDDGSSTNFIATDDRASVCNPRPVPCLINGNLTPPYISNQSPIRIGATGTFQDDVIFTQGGSPSAPTYRFQPLEQVVGPDNAAAPATFENTRPENAAPDEELIAATGTPEVKIASFNVLNYFTTLGDANNDDTGDGGCVAYWDRDGDGNNVDDGCNQRGAWDPQDLQRQQTKIVTAINALDADVVGLMEIENSKQLGETPDEAVTSLVAALNADAGPGTWAANPSSSELPAAGMDVITNAIIYKPGAVERTGDARALGTLSDDGEAFGNAREPIAQGFTPVGGGAPFLVVVNHFKSKGSAGPFPGDADSGDGQGASNESRKRQAQALADWVPTIQGDIEDVYLIGDFNSYAQEDPMRILYDEGYTNLEVDSGNDEYSYSFSGLSGSLDHVLANASGLARYTGADIWGINAGESVAMEYSRFNYHATNFNENGPFRSSDHDPVIVGLGEGDSDITKIQLLATNDFHGRLNRNATDAQAGAAVLSGAVKQLRQQNSNTVFAAAGDLIGASTFESFIQQDKPTIDALNEAGLEVSAAGNHEFDAGYEDLVGRVQDLATWEYLAANVEEPAGRDDLRETWTKTFGTGDDEVVVGFVGAVTEDLPSLVSPSGMQGVTVTDIVDATNEAADELKTEEGADLVVLLVHEGAATTSYAAATDSSVFGQIVNGVNANVDAIVSGHTHLAYDHAVPVPEWETEDRPVTTRPVVSAGQYGYNLNQLEFAYDTEADEVVGLEQRILALQTCTNCPTTGTQAWSANYPADPDVTPIVTAANNQAEVLGAAELGEIEGTFNRSKLTSTDNQGNLNENRGGESTLGNLVAEVQRWATETEEAGEAEIAFMNPGGLRADMVGTLTGQDRTLTYRQAALVQPFANTLVNMDLTGAQIKTVLEQQWQRDGNNKLPSRPFLRLGISKGFTYTYTQETVTETPTNGDPAYQAPRGVVTGMWLDGEPIDPTATYSVTVNSFLASGGDNFRGFNAGTNKRDTGKADLQAMVDYMEEFAADAPLDVDYSQRSVRVAFPAGAPTSYRPGDTVRFDLSSLAMAGPGNVQDAEIRVYLDEELVDTAAVDNASGTEVYDNYGRASVELVVPAGTPAGATELVVRGPSTGTEVVVPITVAAPPVDPGPTTVPTTTTATAQPMTYGTNGTVTVSVTPATASGAVTISNGATQVGAGTVTNGTGTVTIDGKALEPGTRTLTVRYAGNATHAASQGSVTVQVAQAATTLSATTGPVDYGSAAAISVTATPATAEGAVTVSEGAVTLATGTLDDGTDVITVAGGLEPGTHTLTVRYAGDARHGEATTTVTLEVRKASSSTSASVRPGQLQVGEGRATLTVSVDAGDLEPTGSVTAFVNGEQVDSATLAGGEATLRVGPFNRAGERSIEVRYSGDSRVDGSSASASVRVVKADTTVTVKQAPKKVKVDKTRVKLTIRVRADGTTPGGVVVVRLAGQPNQRVGLDKDGTAVVRLEPFGQPGDKVVTVEYLGDQRTAESSTQHVIDVVRR